MLVEFYLSCFYPFGGCMGSHGCLFHSIPTWFLPAIRPYDDLLSLGTSGVCMRTKCDATSRIVPMYSHQIVSENRKLFSAYGLLFQGYPIAWWHGISVSHYPQPTKATVPWSRRSTEMDHVLPKKYYKKPFKSIPEYWKEYQQVLTITLW